MIETMQKNLCNCFILIIFLWFGSICDARELFLVTSKNSFVTGIERFGTDLECRVNSCLGAGEEINWMFESQQITQGLRSLIGEKKAHIRHNVFFNHSRDCHGQCSDSAPCNTGERCLDNNCCFCSGEEYSLVLKNLTMSDAGLYRCLLNTSNHEPVKELDFQLDIVETGLAPNFHENFTYNFTDCCRREGVSDRCMAPCNLKQQSSTLSYDPTQCSQDMPRFLKCATDGGNVSHLHCCKLQLVPPFCWAFCTGEMTELLNQHRLCLYWLQEIFECYEQAFLPNPGPPEKVEANTIDSNQIEVCWERPEKKSANLQYYTIHYKEIPQFPFLSNPFFSNPDEEEIEGSQHEFLPDAIPPAPPQPFDESRASRIPRLAEYSVDDQAAEEALEDPSGIHLRPKRQTLIFVTHNLLTNETQTTVKEYKFQLVNVSASEKCYTIKNLTSSTQYFIYVTATNDFGTSLPSVRSVAETFADSLLLGNKTALPDVESCCRKNNVSPQCIPRLCDLTKPPSPMGALDIALSCRAEFSKVAPCLADGRDHSSCCRKHDVSGACLQLCNGSAAYLNLHSVICLTVDMENVYSCLRSGYSTIPSPPQNVSVFDVTTKTAKVRWDPPVHHSQKVDSYSLFYKIDTFAHGFDEIKNVKSPHVLLELQPSTPYILYLIAKGANGDSLKSSVEEFYTESDSEFACSFGAPLLDPTGGIVHCDGSKSSCPEVFTCKISRSIENSFCCPKPQIEATPLPNNYNVTQCCADHGVAAKCQSLCNYDVKTEELLSKGHDCLSYIPTWVECVGNERDHKPCCINAGVPEACVEFCTPPILKLHEGQIQCIAYVEDMLQCAETGVLRLPGPPRFVRFREFGDDFATVEWDPPNQPARVRNYEITLYDSKEVVRIVNVTDKTNYKLEHLKTGLQYQLNVRSFNEHGSSIRSNNITFTMEEKTFDAEADFKPAPPHEIRAVWIRARAANITWKWTGKSVNGRNISNFEFRVFYKIMFHEDSQPKSSMPTSNFSMVIDGLETLQHYEVWVIATNKNLGIDSKPSEFVEVVPQKADPTTEELIISVTPEGPYIVGQKVTLTCDAFSPVDVILTKSNAETLRPSQSNPNVRITDKPLATGKGQAIYNFTVVPENHGQKIFCEALINGHLTQSTFEFVVKHAPEIFAKSDSESVFAHSTAFIWCALRAFPEPAAFWFFADTSGKKWNVSGGGNAFPDLVKISDFGPLVYNMTLTIRDVKIEQSGFYFCHAKNQLGDAEDKVRIQVDDAMKLPNGPDEISRCCKSRDVPDSCLSACTFDIDISAYDSENGNCVQYFPALLECARDGHDHRACCITEEVHEDCLQYCNGNRNAPLAKTDPKCSQYARQMIHCLEENHDRIPGVPINIKISQNRKGALQVQWDAPENNADFVEIYAIYFRRTDRKADPWDVATLKKFSQGTRSEPFSYDVHDLQPDYEYEICMAAGNHYGFSSFSKVQVVKFSKSETFVDDSSQQKTFSAGGSKSSGIIWAVIICLALVAIAVIGGLYLMRNSSRLRQKLPSIFNNGHQAPAAASHRVGNESVSFENPGYGDEDRNRQFSGEADYANSEWQSADLESPLDDAALSAKQNGMKYAQFT